MPTRRADELTDDAAQERFMSSREYVARRGILGNAVAAKARLYKSAAHRSLLFFLQGLSMDDGGLRAMADDLFEMFPNNLISFESISGIDLALELKLFQLEHDTDLSDSQRCATKRRWFADFLERLCIDPSVDVEAVSSTKFSSDAAYFRDPIGAIVEYRKRHSAALLARTAVTSIGSEIHRWLDRALSTRRIIVIEGPSGSGKTHAAELWCRRHLGEARFVTLSGITHRTGLFQKIGAALGLAICQHASSKLQAKVEAHLASTRLMLVIDEAHFLWPQHKRTHSAPELIDWIDTVVNMGVPVALVCTDQFAKLKSHVEKQTGWTADQFIHRTGWKETIEKRPTKTDLLEVTRTLLSYRWGEENVQWIFDAACRPDPASVKVIALYAENNHLPLPSIRNTIDGARVLAREREGTIVNARDIKQALESRQQSDVAIRAAFGGRSKPSRRHSERVAAPAIGREQITNFDRIGDDQPPIRSRSTSVVLSS